MLLSMPGTPPPITGIGRSEPGPAWPPIRAPLSSWAASTGLLPHRVSWASRLGIACRIGAASIRQWGGWLTPEPALAGPGGLPRLCGGAAPINSWLPTRESTTHGSLETESLRSGRWHTTGPALPGLTPATAANVLSRPSPEDRETPPARRCGPGRLRPADSGCKASASLDPLG